MSCACDPTPQSCKLAIPTLDLMRVWSHQGSDARVHMLHQLTSLTVDGLKEEGHEFYRGLFESASVSSMDETRFGVLYHLLYMVRVYFLGVRSYVVVPLVYNCLVCLS